MQRRHPRARRPAGQGPDHRLRRLRPDRGVPPRREPGPRHGAGLAPAARRHARSRWSAAAPAWSATRAASATSGRCCRWSRSTGTRAAIRRQLAAVPRFRGRHRGAASEQRRLAPAALTLMEFLRDTGKHFTLNYMLQKESVRSRMETGISFTEFSLHAGPGLRLLAPVPHRGLRAADGRQRPVGQHHGGHRAGRAGGNGARRTAWSFPFSPRPRAPSSARARAGTSGSIPHRTSPYAFYQFWLNTDDRDVERCLKLFTFLRLDEIAGVMAEHRADPGAAERAADPRARDDGRRPRRRGRRVRDPDEPRPVFGLRR